MLLVTELMRSQDNSKRSDQISWIIDAAIRISFCHDARINKIVELNQL